MQQPSPKTDLLFIRMDKIGDLVLSLNLDQAVNLKDPTGTLITHWWIAEGLEVIPVMSQPQKQFIAWPKKFSFKTFIAAYQSLRKQPPKMAILLHGPLWVALVLWLARVPFRIGRRSQWWSFLFYNVGLRQKRSLSEHHESSYNFDLLRQGVDHLHNKGKLLELAVAEREPAPLTMDLASAPKDLSALHSDSELLQQEYIVIHAGMAGSALNWPTECYLQIIKSLSQKHLVVLTGTQADLPFLEPLKIRLQPQKNLLWLDGQLTLQQLLHVVNQAKLTIAPSTGVLHLSASLGRPSLGLYSPLRAHHPQRWGPRGKRAIYLLPTGFEEPVAIVPENVMSLLSVGQVLEAAQKLLEE